MATVVSSPASLVRSPARSKRSSCLSGATRSSSLLAGDAENGVKVTVMIEELLAAGRTLTAVSRPSGHDAVLLTARARSRFAREVTWAGARRDVRDMLFKAP